jgi:hypothetical protein
MSDYEIYLLIKYIKSVLWRVAKCLSYIEEARCLKVNITVCVKFTILLTNILIRSNKMQQYAGIFFTAKLLYVFRVSYRTHHQGYIKL